MSEGLIVAGIPLWGYVCAFVHELAFAHTFRFPSSFIRVDLGSVLGAVGMIVTALVLFGGPVSVLPRRPWLAPLALIFELLMGLFLAWLLIWVVPNIIGGPRWIWIIAGVILAIWCLLVIALVLIQPILRYEGPWLGRWNRARIEAAKAHPETVLFGVFDKIVESGVDLRTFTLLFWLIWGSLTIAYWGGRAQAITQFRFLVLVEDSTVVVLRRYGEYFLCARLNPSTRTTLNEFELRPVAGANGGGWRFQNLGRLRRADE